MVLRMSWWVAAALVLAALPPASLNAQQAAPQQQPGSEAQPYRTVSVLGLLGRVVEDSQGRPVGVVRDVVMARDGFGPVLALLDVQSEGSRAATVALPAHDLRLGPDGIVRLGPDVPGLAGLPEINHPLGPAAGLGRSPGQPAPPDPVPPDSGLMVATPGGGLPQVQPQSTITPQTESALPEAQ